MNQTLQQICDLQIENEEIVKKASFLQYGEMVKLGALFYTSEKLEADEEKIRECKEILKKKTGVLSNFRGNMEYALQIKMAMASDPEAYLDNIISIYNRLVEGRKLPGEILVMTAITIYERSKDEDIDAIIAKTKEMYAEMRSAHKVLTDETDMSFIALMVMSGKDVEKSVKEVEELYLALKEKYRMPSDSAQAAAFILSMSGKTTEQKVDDYVSLYQKLKESKHGTSKGKAMLIYAAFADLDVSSDTLIEEIGEVDTWLKKQKSYGMLSISSDVRKVLAATLVLQQYRSDDKAALTAEASSIVSQVIAEEIILTIIMMIVISMSVHASMSH